MTFTITHDAHGDDFALIHDEIEYISFGVEYEVSSNKHSTHTSGDGLENDGIILWDTVEIETKSPSTIDRDSDYIEALVKVLHRNLFNKNHILERVTQMR